MNIFQSDIKLSNIIYMILILFIHFTTVNASESPILIGLDADMSSGSARAGIAIERGAMIAIDEINLAGGVLGRQLELKVKDHRGNPARGVDNMNQFAGMDSVVAVLGGLHTPVAMSELDTIHKHNMIFLVPWAAGTPVIENSYKPNYAFRVSVRDEYAGGFLIKKIIEAGYRNPALLLEQTGWGRSNKTSMTSAMNRNGLTSAGIYWFNWGVNDLGEQIHAAKNAGADVLLLVANCPEGVVAVKSMSLLPETERIPIVSHWGITGGNFFEMTKEFAVPLSEINFYFLQTYSFLKPVFSERNDRLIRMYQKKYPETLSADNIFSPAGTAHAYDLVHLLKKALEIAGTTDRSSVRDALEKIPFHEGLLKNYVYPFREDMHDALNEDDFILAKYNDAGVIVPYIFRKILNHDSKF
ncbi:Extracellular ligand-binding receptor [Desulfamplus magnetovallimortis]|uniref:Extracellular ligand-binding receptor n=1 Tax=Desulfamplus magnetovallimortis TaxID=1246637 RepID=A0A1W1HJ41_9BACT|nr:ABC transporter substrate-binding protein [Desulfamplus magnetovallimortis]SLM32521.1 Extracellular ligand-binding receptor [Desulfamplus magnetovallimortis]